ncbi:sensor histidine kinase [Actinoplanes hulinensis]|uniref:histidine kinase n=1 Tax=Actinoplanes hulinensis TaxID=1144547 RepID=A0ABS7BFY0_9ACTN|nr:histidine kinase [Actinoplanes hulinensis]MBW6439743.1 sensor histidine kinase [Actinoplanes hulinensis]
MSALIGWKGRVRGEVLRHPQLTDAALGVMILLLVLGAMVADGDDHESHNLRGMGYAAAAAAAALIAVRRLWPVPILAAATLATAAATAVPDLLPQFAVAALVCAYTVTSIENRRRAWLSVAVAAVVVYLAAVLVGGSAWRQPETVTALAWAGMAAALGDAARMRRGYLAAVLERARRAEHTREEEARRRVVEERLRIARELHDVVAHHIAVINIQAGVAAHVLTAQPGKAQESLTAVRHAARTVLEEMSTVLGVLRAPDDPAEHLGEPPPGLSRLDALLSTVAAGGLRVAHVQQGSARQLPAAVDHAAFRIVQEALTNAHKHGAGDTVELRLVYTNEDVQIYVDNAEALHPSTPPAGSGHGLLGVRERAAAVGGTVTAGHDGTGNFRLQARLPAPPTRNEP